MCFVPISYKGIPCKCNRCPECLGLNRNELVYRCEIQERKSAHSYFLTLTYSPEFLPNEAPWWPDFTDFRKEVFRRCGYAPKYAATHEFGDRHGRSHFHVLVYSDKVIEKHVFQEAWHRGHVCYKPITKGRTRYAVSYAYGNDPWHKQDTRNCRISNGLGADPDIDHRYNRYTGISSPMPRYYRRKYEPAKAWSKEYFDKKYSGQDTTDFCTSVEMLHRRYIKRVEKPGFKKPVVERPNYMQHLLAFFGSKIKVWYDDNAKAYKTYIPKTYKESLYSLSRHLRGGGLLNQYLTCNSQMSNNLKILLDICNKSP